MKATICTFLLILSTNLASQERYPSYKTVVTLLFNQYLVNVDEYSKVNFQKKPTGWYIATERFDNGHYQEIESELFWEKKSDSFKVLKFKKKPEDLASAFSTYKKINAPSEEVNEYLENWDARLFSICPYYNYDGWERDVVNDFGKSDARLLSDTTLYALGRAYSSYASHLLSNQYGLSNTIKQFQLERNENLSQSQLKKYRKYQHGAINAFQQLAERNPGFQTIIGSIGVKAANEHITSYINLLMYSDEQEALNELKDNLYDDFYLALARNYLNSCAPNSILLTGGDNDTFPLWYLQAKYGVRRDVTVMVLSYLNTNRFIDLMSSESSIFEPIKISIDRSNYDENGPNAYLPFIQKVDGAIDIKRYLGLINEEHEGLRYDLGDSYYNIVPSSELTLSSATFFDQNSLSTSLSEYALDPEMSMAIKAKGLEMKDLVLLDIFTTNDWERPIYFNNTSLSQLNVNLDNNTVQEGLCYQFLPLEKKLAVDHEKMYNNIKNKFDWDFIPLTKTINIEEKNLILNYRSAINNLVESLLANNDKKRAKEILTASFSWMSQKVFPLDYFSAVQVQYLLKLDETELAMKIADELFDQTSEKLKKLLELDSKNTYEAQTNLYIVKTLIDTFSEHDMRDFVSKYEAAYQKYEVLIYEPGD